MHSSHYNDNNVNCDICTAHIIMIIMGAVIYAQLTL